MPRTDVPGARVFTGAEIADAIRDAVEALDENEEITEFHAGENMQITYTRPVLSYDPRDVDTDTGVIVGWDTLAWTGERWEVITSC